MKLESEISSFHERINYDLHQQSWKSLIDHGMQIVFSQKGNQQQIKVRSFHFMILSAKRKVSATPIMMNSKASWQEINEQFNYYEKELQEYALQALYLTNTVIGECIVERSGTKEINVVSLRPLALNQLTTIEKRRLAAELRKLQNINNVTFGADLELMLQNQKTGKFMNGDILRNEEFGFDQAIALHKTRIYHPIIEIRPKPAFLMKQLHNHMLLLYEKLLDESKKHHLTIITVPNPSGRFFLGGHLHFGNIPFTLKHVRLLDQFVALPFSLTEGKPSYERRKGYGRLGSVRKNRFDGFEYRVLPTWFQHIPTSLPMLLLIEYLVTYPQFVHTSTFTVDCLTTYYNQAQSNYSLDEWFADHKQFFLENKGENILSNYVSYLKKL